MATSMRAENGEKRALEADIRAARLELEVREREAEITRERCELLETVRASEKERAASCVRAVKAEQRAFETGSRAAQFDTERERAVGLTRERDELLEILKTAEEECAVSSMRAGKTEQRALEAESRAARLETEVRERVAESARERCEMLEGLRAAQADYSATSVRVDEAEKRAVEAETRAARLEIETRTRAAESTRERCELLEGLRAAKEECAATSVRAEKAERRALEVENRAAEVEKEEREREAQRSRERCELLERLRTAKRAKRSVRVANVEQTATAAKRRAAHVGNEEREKVLVGVTRERCELLGVMKTAKEARAATSVRAVKSEGRAIETKSRVARLNEACEHTDRLLERIKVGVTEDQLTSAADEIFLASEIWGGEKRGEASVEASLLSVGRESVQKPDCGSVGPLGKEGRFETGENGSACLVEVRKPILYLGSLREVCT